MDRQSHKFIPSGCKFTDLGVCAVNNSLVDVVKDGVGGAAASTRAGVIQG